MYIQSSYKIDDTTLDIKVSVEAPQSSQTNTLIGLPINFIEKGFISADTSKGLTILGKVLKKQDNKYIIDCSITVINSSLGSLPLDNARIFSVTYDNKIHFPSLFQTDSSEKKELLKACIDLIYDFDSYKRIYLIKLNKELHVVELFKTLSVISVTSNSLSNILRANRALKLSAFDNNIQPINSIDLLTDVNKMSGENSLLSKLRIFLKIDRVIIYRFHKEKKIGKIIEESKSDRAKSLLGLWVEDPCFDGELLEQYRNNDRFSCVENINNKDVDPCLKDLVLNKLDTVAEVVLPISIMGEIWGLIACHCKDSRKWQEEELFLIEQCRDNIINKIKYSLVQSKVRNLENNFERVIIERNKTLSQTNHLLQTVIDNLPLEIALKDTNGKFLLVNKKLSNYAGFSNPKEMIGKTDFDCPWTLEETKHYRRDDLRVIKSKKPLMNVLEHQTTAKGETIWLNTSKIPVIDEEGQVQSVLIAVLDVTQLRNIKTQLSQSKSILETVVSESQSILYTVDLDGYLDIIQGKGWALMNINPQEMTGINIFDTDLLDSFSKENIKSVLEGDNKEWVSNIRNRTLRNTSRPIYSSNSDILGAVVFGFDITDIISKTEELQQFAYVASHDLQEPLRMITNFLELLLHWYGPGTNKPLDDTAYHFIDRAVQGSKRMKRLIEDLLKYSRVETKAKEKQWLDVNKIISEVLENLYVQIEEKNADIEVDNKLDKVKADKPQLQQVIQNLINNGLKFNENIPSIKISTTENDNYWIFSIEDNGIGIDLKYRNKILEPFKRLHTQSEYSGTGMGLAICKRIIDRHKGSIEIESQIGKGSCFTFSIMKDD